MSTTHVLIRPRRSLLTTALGAIVVAMIPIFGVLYWFGFERGSWVLVFVVHVGVVLLSLAVLARQLTVYAAVTDTELLGTGIFSPTVRVALDEIAQLILVETYVGQSPDTVTQLLVRDAQGRRLFRMRGNFWQPTDLADLVAALPIAATTVGDPMSATEFFRQYPGSAYWFENRPVLRALAVIAALGLLTAIIAWVVGVLGFNIPGL